MTEDTTPAETVDPADETVEVRENPGRNRFDILVGGRQAGFALFTTPAENPDDQRIFYHTVIDDAFGGRGLAGVLTRGALAAVFRVILLQRPGLLARGSVVFVTGSLRLVDIVRSQAAAPWSWLVTRTPVFPFLVLAMLAAPLVRIGGDPGALPEAELSPEPEGSGLAAACGALARWMSAHGAAALVAIVFLGGFHVPFVDRTAVETKVGYGVLAALILLLKTWTVLFVLLAAKRTLPRLSTAQAMGPLFRVVLPASVLGLAGSLGFLAWDPDLFTRRLLAFATTGLVLAVAIYAGKRTTVRSAGRLHGHVSPFI